MTSRPNPISLRPDYSSARTRAADHLYRAAAATFLSFAGGQTIDDVLHTNWPDDRVTPILWKAATSPAALSSSTWAGSLASAAVAAAVVGLAPQSAAANLIARGLSVSLEGHASITVPAILVSATDAGDWVSEGNPFRIRQPSVAAGPTLSPFKLLVGRVYTNELARYAIQDVENVMRATLGQAFALALDAKVFGNAAASAGLNPAGLLNGLTTLTAATGGGAAAFAKDIETLVAAIAAAGGGTDPVFIVAPGQAAGAANLAGPKFNYPVWPSAAVPAGTIIAVEAPSFVSGFDSVPTFDVSTETTLHMEDTTSLAIGTAGTPNVVAAPLRGVWQTDTTAVKMLLRCSFGMRATGHVQFISGCTW